MQTKASSRSTAAWSNACTPTWRDAPWRSRMRLRRSRRLDRRRTRRVTVAFAPHAALPGSSAIEEASQLPRPARVFELAQRLGLDLPDTLARHREFLADFLERVIAVHAEAKAH